MNLKEYIASVPNYPKEGIIFRDISPLMANGKAYQYATQQIVDYARKIGADMIVGPEARGFIVGCPVAYELGIGFAPARKKGKLPRETVAVEYDLEYGSAELHLHKDAVKPGQKVLICDDLLATGGTMAAAAKLVEKIVSRATENTLLQLDRTILICLFLVLAVDVMAVFLVFQSNLKILGLILLVIDFLVLVFVFYLRFVSRKVIDLVLNDSINLKLYVDMFRVQSEKSIKPFRATYRENYQIIQGRVAYLKGNARAVQNGNVLEAPELKIQLSDNSAETLGGRSTLIITPK